MASELTFTDPGEGIHEAEVAEILVAVGDHVEDGDTVMAVETDKATSEIASPFSGEVTSIDVEVGQIVEVGDVLITFDGADTVSDEPSDEVPAEPPDDRGSGGATEPEKSAAPTTASDRRASSEPVPASPSTRRIARELGIDLTAVEPSGPAGRVTTADVHRTADAGEEHPVEDTTTTPEHDRSEARPNTSRTDTSATSTTETGGDSDHWGPVTREPLRGVRRAIAKQMTASWAPIARVTHHDLVDITELERLRRRHRDGVDDNGTHLGLLPIVLKAVAATLREYPRFNASLDTETDEIIIKHYVHLGVAVDTDDGLLVPVLRDVDRKSIEQLARELPGLIERTRARDLDRDEMSGASFTVTNVGPLGGTSFTPMVNHPEVAILGMARARLEQRLHGDIVDPAGIEAAVRLMLPLSLSFDHRVNDGADAARFVTDLGALLSDPERLLLAL